MWPSAVLSAPAGFIGALMYAHSESNFDRRGTEPLGSARDWLGYATQHVSFAIGGLVSPAVDGSPMLDAAVASSTLVADYTRRADIRWVRRTMRSSVDED